MFFVLSKVIWFLLAPSNLLVLLIALGLLLAALTRLRRSGLVLAGIACAGLFVFGMTPLSNLFLRTLEARFPIAEPLTGAIDGIVILGGSQDPDASIDLGQPVLKESAERLVVGSALARRFPDARILISGGSGALTGSDNSEARAGALMLESLGLDPARILIEERSRNTHKMPCSRGTWRSRRRARPGCWSPPPSTCPAPSACSARRVSWSCPIRWISEPWAMREACGAFPRSPKACVGLTLRCTNMSGSSPIV